MLPEGWKRQTVADICEMQNGHGFGPNDWGAEGLPIIRIQNLNGGQKFDFYAGPTEPRWIVDPGQLLFAWAGTKGVSFGPTIWRGKRGVLNQHIFKVHANAGIDSAWLYWALRHVTDRIEANAHGFKATLVHVKKSDIDRQSVIVPDQGTQTRIAEVMQTWDEAITATEKLLANSCKQKQELMRALLTGKKRFTRLQGSWQHLDFDDVFERVTRKNFPGNSNVLTISGQLGLVSQSEYFNKSVASENLSGYTLLERYNFAYNKSYSAGYPQGAIKPLVAHDAGVVSSLYVCFRIKAGVEADFDFFRHYFEAGLLNEEISGIAQEGARNHGLLNVSVTDFFKLRLHIPPVPVQRKIAEAINVAEAEERLFENQLERLQTEKRALMQQLLTGKRRVRLPASEATP
ncbi:MAG: restriction endonuclease subunit S [Rhodocyclaceae bacterium]|nr:restriction endonuclease subunit S [Rhodocyclaceae bacterium]